MRVGPYRFFFYANEGQEPPHVHVEREWRQAKSWLDPVRLSSSMGFAKSEVGRVQERVEENSPALLRSWHEFFAR